MVWNKMKKMALNTHGFDRLIYVFICRAGQFRHMRLLESEILNS